MPFAKTGGLADVCGSLPIELSNLGHDPIVFLPAYRQVAQCGQEIKFTDIDLEIPIGTRTIRKTVRGRLLKSTLPASDVPVYLVEQNEYFDRPELYTQDGVDYEDNCERFVFFCRAVLESIRLLKLSVDLVHCNDWQTGLLPVYLKTEYIDQRGYEEIASLLTIHNLAYQGSFWHWDMQLTGIDWKYYNWQQMECHQRLNLLKSGIVFADSINTVSPTYAQEIQKPPLGCGLQEVLKHRSDVLSGIINGVDYQVWNPDTDPVIAKNYNASKLKGGKAKCKAALQREMGLPEEPAVPLIGLISRLADQKGWHLITEVMQRWAVDKNVQWVILGTGQPEYHKMLADLAAKHPDRVATSLTFSDALAHRIEAGADMFVMASQYEPCGLNQLYSLQYGTVPIVRETGGLADSIVDATEENLKTKTANGFRFKSFDASSLDLALTRAYDVYREDRKVWKQLMRTGMRQDWSWTNSAKQYLALYETTVDRRKSYTPTSIPAHKNHARVKTRLRHGALGGHRREPRRSALRISTGAAGAIGAALPVLCRK